MVCLVGTILKNVVLFVRFNMYEWDPANMPKGGAPYPYPDPPGPIELTPGFAGHSIVVWLNP